MKLTKKQIAEKREEPRWDVTAKEKLANWRMREGGEVWEVWRRFGEGLEGLAKVWKVGEIGELAN